MLHLRCLTGFWYASVWDRFSRNTNFVIKSCLPYQFWKLFTVVIRTKSCDSIIIMSIIFDNFFLIYIQYNLHFFEQEIYSHQVLIYLNVPGIPVTEPLQNRQIDSWRTTGYVSLGVICASLLTGRHLLMNKKDKNSRYTNIKIMII